MKKLIKLGCAIIVLLALSPQAYAVDWIITDKLLFDSVAITASGSSMSDTVDLRQIATQGYFAIHYTISGSGTAKVEYLVCSTKDGTYLTPATASNIATGKTSGTYYAFFEPELTPYIKIKVTETGGADSVTVTLRLIVQ